MLFPSIRDGRHRRQLPVSRASRALLPPSRACAGSLSSSPHPLPPLPVPLRRRRPSRTVRQWRTLPRSLWWSFGGSVGARVVVYPVSDALRHVCSLSALGVPSPPPPLPVRQPPDARILAVSESARSTAMVLATRDDVVGGARPSTCRCVGGATRTRDAVSPQCSTTCACRCCCCESPGCCCCPSFMVLEPARSLGKASRLSEPALARRSRCDHYRRHCTSD